ncbi:TPA: site-specific DNA-methyltransferase [Enterococcus faecalis]|uniref:site-specific DNA-methyltransferase n=1 Tax=Enterococcus TaxID=1350 RepID=UPI001330F9D5|nr:site-specific DNA-methyltransferase [Enterococcus faecalis]MCI0137696.1 site-specific DNA-methyltransferase [Enterococcus faecalis]HCJ0858980.1 site-specific DNA-methyltransferase [Enterococcus faecalis]HCJ4774406.1 site-specific DNA-methyltransferase [Enterococcus faecalis]
MDTRLMQQIKDILKEFPQYWNGEELQRPIVIDDLKSYDALLISALLKNQKIRENYSVKAGDVVIFKVQEFIDILRYKDYWADSYTKYSNTIGLSSEGKYLQYNTDVVLDFPYKDCVLEGGMTKEDVGKEEVFYNEIIARDEIDTLLAPKAFVNVKKFDADGEHKVDTFSDDDNLIIKGNNLLGLTSLLKRYEGKIKCIYIDPPYNTRTDANTFSYNNRFNHSTWLTFMKNRLEQAKKLLKEDGVIFIDIDHYELFYLGVLADEVFGYENRLGVLSIVHNLKGRFNEFFSTAHENKIVYAKDASKATIKEFTHDNSENYPHEDEIGRYKLVNLQRTGDGSRREDRPNLYYPIWVNPISKELSTEKQEGFSEVLPIDSKGIHRRWRWGKAKVNEEWKSEIVVKEKDNVFKLYTKLRMKGEKPKSIWIKPEYSGTTGTNQLKSLLGDKVFSYPKSVTLVKDSIQIVTEPDDIILDYHAGSGTTGQAVIELNREDNGNRKFILIEQMDYINSVTVPRIRKVIDSTDGSFVYAELMELNQMYMNKIEEISSKEGLADLWNELDNNADLNFQLDKEKLVNELLKEHDEQEGSITFNDLTFEEQKEIFKKALDKNQLYVPYSEIEDANIIISDIDKSFNHSFYNGEVE